MIYRLCAEPFDVIILSDLVNDLWDVQGVFEQVRSLCDSHTRLILNFYSGLWHFPLSIAQRLNLAVPMLGQNWLTREDASNMLGLAGFDVIRQSQEILWPFPLGGFANKFLVRLWPFRELRAFQSYHCQAAAGNKQRRTQRFNCCSGAERVGQHPSHL